MSIPTALTYIITFLAVYVQVFFLVTFIEKRKAIAALDADDTPVSVFPRVAIIVPCWNEEKTVHGTIESLLAMEYPKDKLEIIIVDDGSTDTTWDEIVRYEHHPQIKIFKKENGGKHTAVNYGIEHTDTELIGCLDADSFVASDALLQSVRTFQKVPHAMAVAPSIIIHNPKTLIQKVQKIEYNMGVYIKKMLSYLGAIHVAPGPFSIFRREVFVRVGMFRKAHNTEDMEIAYRMQEQYMHIEHSHRTHVYTVGPNTIKKLYKQRVRWIYGFIQNTIDYRRLLFKKKYGNFSFFTLPSGVISIVAAVYIFFTLAYNAIVWLIAKAVHVQTVGLRAVSTSAGSIGFNVDWFYINTQTIVFLSVTLYTLLIIAMVIGTRMAKQKLSLYIIAYIVIYSVVAPLWLLKAIINSLTAHKPSWR